MPASRVTSRRLSALKLRSSSSRSARRHDGAAGGLLALLARQGVAGERDPTFDLRVRELGVRLFTL